jgi:hypothetical protein
MVKVRCINTERYGKWFDKETIYTGYLEGCGTLFVNHRYCNAEDFEIVL